MSFLYRPTPVVNWGNGPFASNRVMGGWPGATMRGIPAGASRLGAGAPTGAVSAYRRVDTRMQPWLKSSGTMGGFIPNGLGQTDPSSIDWSTAGDISPVVPTFTPPDLTPPTLTDLTSSPFSPNTPAFISPSAGPSLPSSFFTNPSPIIPPSVITDAIPPPVGGAGPTGVGIPGTQPLSAASVAAPVASIAASIASLFTPKPAAPAGYTGLPGSGGSVATAPAGSLASPLSWFSQATILAGTPNYVTLFGGAAILLLVSSIVVGGKAGYKR